MWAAILAGREGGHDSLFSQNERILDFGKLVTFDTDRGIDEAKWKLAAAASDPTDPLADGELAQTARSSRSSKNRTWNSATAAATSTHVAASTTTVRPT